MLGKIESNLGKRAKTNSCQTICTFNLWARPFGWSYVLAIALTLDCVLSLLGVCFGVSYMRAWKRVYRDIALGIFADYLCRTLSDSVVAAEINCGLLPSKTCLYPARKTRPTNLHNGGAQFVFLDGHVARFRNTEYWNFATGKGITNSPALVWIP